MTGKPGRYLSPEQSARLAVVDSVSRDKLIEMIVLQMRAEQRKRDRRVSRLRVGAERMRNRFRLENSDG